MIASIALIKDLVSLGFSPLVGVLFVVILSVWGRFEYANRKQSKTRENWHSETRERVEQVEKHSEECNKDRENLKNEMTNVKSELAVLKDRDARVSRCPKKDCPNRLPP